MLKRLAHAINNSYISRSFGYLSFAQGINAVSSFAVMTVFTRFLPPEDYGRVSMLWLFMMILSVFVDFRLNSAFCIRFYKISRDENTRNLYSIIAFNAVVAAAIYVLWSFFPELVARMLKIPITAREILLVCMLNLAMVVSKLFTSLLLVTRQARMFFKVSLLSTVILIPSCIYLLFYLQVGYHSYFYGHLIAYGIMASVGMAYIWKEFPPVVGELISFDGLRRLTKLSLPLIPDAFLMMLLASAGRYFLNIYHGLASVAIYSVSYMFGSVFNTLVLGPLGQAITPVLYEKFARSEEQYSEYLGQVFKYYWVVLLSIILGCFVGFQEAFPLMVGEKYIGAFNIILIIMAGMVISGGASLLSCTIVLKEKTHLVFLITLISVIANIVSGILLIPPWGLFGAAMAGFIGYLIQGTLITYFTQRMVRVDLQTGFLSRFILLAAAAGLIYVLVAQLAIPSYYQILLKMGTFVTYLVVLGKWIGVKKLLARQ